MLNLTGTLITCLSQSLLKAISKMKSGRAAGPPGIVVEMIKEACGTGATCSGQEIFP